MALSRALQNLGIRALGHEAHVVEVTWMSSSVARLRAACPRVGEAQFPPGCKVKVHVGNGQLRSYTPARVDPDSGTVDLVVFAQGQSAASQWMRSLKHGDVVHFVGPATSVSGPRGDEPWVGFFGDETAIGLAEAVLGALPSGIAMLGGIEIRPGEDAAVQHLPLVPATRGPELGAGLVEQARTVNLPDGPGAIWISGETTTVVAVRDVLLGRGVDRSQLRIKPYWSARGKAHRKKVEQTVLRQH